MATEPSTAERSRWQLLLAALAVCLAASVIQHLDWRPAEIPVSDEQLAAMRPLEKRHGGFIGSDACRECHAENHASWHRSWHRTMTQEARLENIIGELNVTNLSFPDTTKQFSLFERDGQAWFRANYAPDHRFPDASRRDEFPIVMTTGSHHQQVYWYPIGKQRSLGVVPVVYLKEAGRWVPRKSVFLRPPSNRYDPETARWNQACLECHTTGPLPKPAEKRTEVASFDSEVAELGISCEACHGPGRDHVARHRHPNSPETRKLTDQIVDPAALDHRRSSQICGACHSVSTPRPHRLKTPYHEPGKELSEHYRLTDPPQEKITALLESNPDFQKPEDVDPDYDARFWWDGMPRIGGREYNGLLRSKCHTAGEMSCLSCHAMHQASTDPRAPEEWADDQLHPDFRGDRACVQCHEVKTYATAEHTHHTAGSSGSRCYNCHMPYTSYALLKSIRSHTISSPQVKETLDAGRPTACNLCHLDQTLEWTAHHLHAWYGQETPELPTVAREMASAARMALQGDAGQRALVAWAMGWPPAVQASGGTNWIPAYLSRLLDDPYDAVRYIAGRSLRTFPSHDAFEYDFLAARTELQAASTHALATWMKNSSHAVANPRVLTVPGGGIDREAFERLLSTRDDRRISLLE